jgi:hypothetical protein
MLFYRSAETSFPPSANAMNPWRHPADADLHHRPALEREIPMIRRDLALALVVTAVLAGGAQSALAQACHRQGPVVSCDDGRRGVLEGNAIIWPDGTRSSSTPHPSVIIGNKSSVVIGPGVYVGHGNGMVPLDDPNAPNKTRCAVLDGVSYCY